ncbi:hypothetical protein DFH06DRAFT_1342533 [Mycena polygramma]|nr:hypothetical protein DFH06DRAFT_1344926 [Mycena polygramma]KAJ7613257.1 hypothetical protein DFH06DRAFT_1344727 [Mycena polygramma]KAJ7618261.1 hypothetical protein DFH06DRAFT_1342533 [Mycena polygramma]
MSKLLRVTRVLVLKRSGPSLNNYLSFDSTPPPAVMTTTTPSASKPSTSVQTELEGLVALVGRLSAVTLEATRLAVEVQAKLPVLVAAEVAAASAAATSAAAVATADAAVDADPVWVHGEPKTPSELEAAFPDGSGETWYVVIRGREPGMYRTAAEADALCNGVPGQLKEKKKSRREALAYYRDRYNTPGPDGVDKLNEV